MSPQMQFKQERNARIIAFVSKHTTEQLFEKLQELYSSTSTALPSRISKSHFILDVLRTRIKDGLLEQSEFDAIVKPMRMKW